MSVTTDAATESLTAVTDAGGGARWLDALVQQRRSWIWWIRGGSMLALVGILLLYAGLTQVLVASLSDSPDKPSAYGWVAMSAGLFIRLLGGWGREYAAQRLSMSVRQALRFRLFAEATHRGPAELVRRGSTAWWAQQLQDQVDALHGYFARYRPSLESARLTPLLIAAIVLSLDWIAGLLLLVAMPLVPLFMALIGMGTQAVQEAQQERQTRLAAELLQRLQTLPWLRRTGALRESADAVGDAADAHRSLVMRVLRVAFLSSATLELFSALAIGLVALYVGFALLGLIGFGPAADMDPWKGLFILMLAPEGFLPLRQLAQAHHDRGAALAAADSLMPLCADSSPAGEPISIADAGQRIAFEAVDYAYDVSARPVLQDLSFSLLGSEVVGLAGPSGSGKSTVLALAAGFLRPTGGLILRAPRWAWVPQRVHLFNGSLRANLHLGCVAPLDDAVLNDALAAVGLGFPHPALPQGLDTRIADGVTGVSGGQAQRIGIARALLSGAPLWLLDEPTAALDEVARDLLLEVLIPLARETGAAVLIASHDSVVLARCDRIIDLAQRMPTS